MQSFYDFLSQPEAYGTIGALLAAVLAYFGWDHFSKKDQTETDETTIAPAELETDQERDLEAGEEAAEAEGPRFETPESLPSRMTRLRARLAKSGVLGKALLSVLSRGDLSESDWEELEETLLAADLGLEATDQIMEKLRTEVKVRSLDDADQIKALLRELLLEQVNPQWDRQLNLSPQTGPDGQTAPAAVLVVGVNGVGKTTTVGKLARILVAEGKNVVLGAADTFRAAAADQLQTWGERVGVEVVRSDREGADPASVAFEAVQHATNATADVVMIDTAGRLHNKSSLMDQLGKIRRVIEKGTQVTETLLVLDATTGQNGLIQARVFAEVAKVTGIVLTKLDGSAKGGIVVSVQKELGVPVKLVGLGEGADDMAPFDAEAFVDSILG
ncbi:signal recognition particle-docking protein FtsY [Boudabousia liubingyangii]|uniref:Signal recognition particle receptor FtsY n=1 Tax=Boudabousia liubingyangii TaxID=1921764 RepID=A0A1Q5PKP9_9ACTO|nr:signal recognition particle-docking protein FtsY [Boudabousia liubingyangii]OKL46470.1 signal recognition particle-docking protein FtsY [Boudabousia liubingyangii]OKL47207.1 signal recognition particle-docking protein FtsY [Boudabousia liubingyangii]